MTLRTRTYIASGIALVVLVLMAVVLFLQYTITAAVGGAISDQLAPAADATASLTLAQANASGALSDYIMLTRESSLTQYRESMTRADTLLDQIQQTIPSNQVELLALLKNARATQQGWVATDAAPVIALMEAGKRSRAMRVTNTKTAWASYNAMTRASSDLNQAVNGERKDGANALIDLNTLLGITLLVTGIVITLGLLAFVLGLRRWVLVPLVLLREDLQRAARIPGHETPIGESGPPELQAVAVDAELLRRELVAEIDEARAAREGLAQDAPLVAAMEAELTVRSGDTVPGLVFAGTSQSAEGVMAGDWWDPIVRPDGSLAIVVADVSGHGPSASVTAVRVRSIIRAGLLSGLSPDRVIEMAAASGTHDTHFVTGIVLVVDPVAGTLLWANAGHHPAIVVTHEKDSFLCEPTGPLISSLGGMWSTRSAAFGSGDVLVAFTDGLVESRNAEGDELESSMVSQFIRGLDAPVRENPEELISRLLAQVRHRAADWRRDDVTLVAAARPR